MTGISRRQFGQGLGAALALAASGRRAFTRPATSVHTITIRAFAFEPSELSIEAGDTVEWSNADIVPHTATARDGCWDTGGIVSRQSEKIRLTEPGIHDYYCVFHPHMAGRVVVRWGA